MSDSREPLVRARRQAGPSDPTIRTFEAPAAESGGAERAARDCSNLGSGRNPARLQDVIRASDGQRLPVKEPSRGLLPEDRYQFAAPGKGDLGKGAIGQVQLVVDSVLGREVAMKTLRDEYASCESAYGSEQVNEARWRFLREARVNGQLEHPNIVPVHELGCRADGTLYYTMRVVRGRTFGEALAKAKTLKQRLALLHHFTDLCHAIAYAHSRGVLHRDIKPSNVMIGEFGETFVLDWGLALVTKQSGSVMSGSTLSLPPNPANAGHASIDYEDHEHTTLGGIVGTPQYMSPEQVLGDHENLDARSDVWSLGVVLYVLLTGRSPFAGGTMSDVLSLVLTKAIPLPVALEPQVPVELQAIAMRALMRDRSARYRDAGEMARDLTAYQSGERVGAYDYGLLDLARRFLERHRAASVVSGIAVCVLVLLAVTSYLRVARARDAALAAERRATAGQRLANTRFADALVERSRAAAAIDDVIEAEILAAEAAKTELRPDARGMLVNLSATIRLAPSSKPVPIGPCSKLVAAARSDKFLCLSDSSLTLLHAGQTQWSLAVGNAIAATSMGHGESAVLSKEGHWALYSDANAQLLAEGNVPLPNATTILGSEQQSWLAVTDRAGNLVVWDPHAPRMRPASLHSNQVVTALAFAHARPTLVLGGIFGRISSWEFTSAGGETSIGDTHTTVESVLVGQRDGLVIAGGSDGTVSIWGLTKGRFLGTALQRQVGIAAMALSEQGRWLLTGTRNSELDLVDMQQRSRVFAMPRGAGPLTPLGFDQNGYAWAVRGSSDLVRYEVAESNPRSRLLDRGNVLALAWVAGSEYVFSGGLRDSGVCLFRVADGTCVDRIPVRLPQVRVLAVSPDGRYLLLAGTGSSIQVWDVVRRLPLTIGEVPMTEVRAAAFDGSQTHVYVGGVATGVFKLRLDSGKVVEHWDIDGHVQTMAMTSDQLLLGLRDGRIQRRDPHGTLLKQAQMHGGWVSGLALSPKSDLGASVGADGKTQFWRPVTLERLSARQDHAGRATALAWSPDGRYLATAGEDQNLVVSDARTQWARVAQWQAHRGTIRTLAFDPTSRWLASGSDDASVRLWDVRILETDPNAIQSRTSASWGLKLVGASVVTQ